MPKKQPLSYRTTRKQRQKVHVSAVEGAMKQSAIRNPHLPTSSSVSHELSATSAEQVHRAWLPKTRRIQLSTSRDVETNVMLPTNEGDYQNSESPVTTESIAVATAVGSTMRNRVQRQPATRGSCICEPTLQNRLATTVVERYNVPAQEDTVALTIIQKRITEKLSSTYCEARFHNDDFTEGSNIGNMDFICKFCDAMLFQSEVVDNSSQICCHKGKIKLEKIQIPPILQKILEKNDEDTRNYLQNIR